MTVASAVLLIVVVIACGFRAAFHWPKDYSVMVTKEGPDYGRVGRIVSTPWIGNGWNLRLMINVSANEAEIREEYGPGWGSRISELIDAMHEGRGPRHWLRVWSWEVYR